jgi:predicted homoserine dehydrogenase-like protein
VADNYLPFTRLKTRDGSACIYLRPHHLVHLELANALRTATIDPPLLNNGPAPVATAAAVVKRPLPAGMRVDVGSGGFDLRGEVVELADVPDAVPITLADGLTLKHAVEPGQILTWSDADVPESLALRLYRETSRAAAQDRALA